jgi:hypothetical protein
MYEIPGRADITRVVVDEAICKNANPLTDTRRANHHAKTGHKYRLDPTG